MKGISRERNSSRATSPGQIAIPGSCPPGIRKNLMPYAKLVVLQYCEYIAKSASRGNLAAPPHPEILHLTLRCHHCESRSFRTKRQFARPFSNYLIEPERSQPRLHIDGGPPRDTAEARAMACCVAKWLNRNPVRSPPGRCVCCGGREQAHDKLLPFGTESAGHAWLHSR